MNNTNVFFGYSPLHFSVFKYLTENYKNTEWILISPDTKFCFENNNFVHIPITNIYSFSNPFKKFFSLILFKNKLSSYSRSISKYYTCNELSPFSIAIENYFRFNNGIIIDEGFLKGAVLKESVLLRYNIKRFIRSIVTLSIRQRFQSIKFNKLITYDKKYFKSFLPQRWNVLDIKNYLISGKEFVINSYYNQNTVFLITSPLTENNNSLYEWQEVDLLYNLFSKNKSLNFVIKPHYRENFNLKYKDLLTQSNVELINTELISVPIQEIDFKSFFVLGFHSSALQHLHLIGNPNVFTLSNLVNSKHSKIIFQSLKESLCYLKNYEDLTKVFQSNRYR